METLAIKSELDWLSGEPGLSGSSVWSNVCYQDPYTSIQEDSLSESDPSVDSSPYGVEQMNDVVSDYHVPPLIIEPSTFESGINTSSHWEYVKVESTQEPSEFPQIEITEELSFDQLMQTSTSSDGSEDDSNEDYDEDSYSSTTMDLSPVSTPNPAPPPTQRQTRSSRNGQLSEVRAMIKQVNSSVDVTPQAPTKSHAKVVKPKPKADPEKESKSNPKKRSRPDLDVRCVTLPREHLLTMTSGELDEFTNRLKADHTLSAHELREIKRQRRLIKNREYAQASRVKKKSVLSDLGSKFTELEEEKELYKQRTLELEAENQMLRARLGLAPALSTVVNKPSNANAVTIDMSMEPPKAKRGRMMGTKSTAGAATLFAFILCAMVFMPSFNFLGSLSKYITPPSSSSPSYPHMPVNMPTPYSELKLNNPSTFRKTDILANPEERMFNLDVDPDFADIQTSHSIGISDTTVNTKIWTMQDVLVSEKAFAQVCLKSAPSFASFAA